MEERKLPQMPRFESEAEEAEWWFDHREELGQDLIAAVERRGPGEGSLGRRARKLSEAKASESAA